MMTLDQLCAAGDDIAAADQAPEPLVSFRTIPVPDLRDEHFYIFSHAFILDSESMREDVGNADMAFCCAVLTFNMALTYHHLGLRMGDSRKLRAACHLYGNCVEMASSVQGVPTPSVGDNLFLLQMMAMNNASQIQYSLAQFAESHDLLSHVRNMMLQIFDRVRYEPDVAQAIELLPGEALDEINLNVVVCLIPTTAPIA
jgi:hypothetical protein